ncbi:hypothetical protein LPY66_18325 [Dehalobacter sp. DCM]|uniref:hypothetical protein n=1 Tax=Dehalobacter sp. DCM TaxID=2907827 RepID=UPI0030815305|nr:hypothetical protein LPY66_18325 [Dehalobacter sp. DCM]
MKIIGQSENSFILEASKDELANLIGYYSKYDQKAKVNPGDEINISNMYRQLYTLERKQPELRKVIDTLRGIANMLEPVAPVIEGLVKESIKDI